jgi:hypothetical protein
LSAAAAAEAELVRRARLAAVALAAFFKVPVYLPQVPFRSLSVREVLAARHQAVLELRVLIAHLVLGLP